MEMSLPRLSAPPAAGVASDDGTAAPGATREDWIFAFAGMTEGAFPVDSGRGPA